MCPFDYMGATGSGTVGPVNRLTTPVWWFDFSITTSTVPEDMKIARVKTLYKKSS